MLPHPTQPAAKTLLDPCRMFPETPVLPLAKLGTAGCIFLLKIFAYALQEVLEVKATILISDFRREK